MTMRPPLERDRDGGQTSRRRRPVFSLVVAAILGAFLLLISVPNLGTTLRAARAQGTPGIFTAERPACVSHLGHQSCTWRGTFTPSAGGPGRGDIYLYGNPTLTPGRQVNVTDVGRSGYVYAGPSREWILTSLVLLAGAGLLIPPAVALARSVAGRKSDAPLMAGRGGRSSW
jgi:hypothetical protein